MLRALLTRLISRRRPDPLAPPPAPASDDPLTRAKQRSALKAHDEALALADEVLEGDPDNAEAAVLRADSLRKIGRIQEAKDAYRRALFLDPRRADAWLDLGVCHHLEEDHFWARVYFRCALVLAPGNANILNESGVVELALGNLERAQVSLEAAVNSDPEHAEAWNNYGIVLARRGDRPGARRSFLRATFLKPTFYMALCNLGLVCRELELTEEAEQALRSAVQLNPKAVTALLNLGFVLQDRGELDEAADVLETARALAPDDADVLTALSALHLSKGDATAACAAARAALERRPNDGDARLALALALLSQRDFAAGWPEYEGRRDSSTSPIRRVPGKPWQGEPLNATSILVTAEQGVGDEIMFSSCLPDLLALGGQCRMSCDPRLRQLLARAFPSIQFIDDPASADAEFTVPLGSLPLHFRRSVTDFPGTAYLAPDAERLRSWRARLAGLGDGLKIGIAWRGGLLRTGRATRSLDLDRLLPLLRAPGVHGVSLQAGNVDEELEGLRRAHGLSVAHWRDAQPLDEAAALISALDLVVTACCTTVHLAGALGQPTWVLTPYAPAWRYGLSGTQMPWYRSVRLFRQPAPRDWSAVIASVTDALAQSTQLAES